MRAARSAWRRHRRRVVVGSLLACVAVPAYAAETANIVLRDRTELAVEQFSARGERLLLQLPTGHGRAEGEAELAAGLAQRGLTVWRPDFFEARFLPTLESSLAEIPDTDLVDVLRAAQATGKRVYVLAAARAGLIAMRLVTAATQAKLPAPAGLILLHPDTYTGAPTPGQEAAYDPAVARVHVPVYVLQPERSPWRWRVPSLEVELRRGGAPVYLQLLPAVRDRFYFREDATADEQAAAKRLPAHIARAVSALTHARAAPVSTAAPVARAKERAERRGLQPYRGGPPPSDLALADLAGKRRALGDYRGRVLLVNFWASWCPPCVHEMPSMQRLQTKLKDRPFTILAVNMGEDERTVRAFLKKVDVNFSVLLDRDGAELKRWKVFVFPTSFLIGPDGNIRYALFGEYQWDDAEALNTIEALMPKR